MAKSFINNSQSVAALAVDSLKLNGKDASLYALKSEISGGGASEIITLTQEEFDALTQDDIAGYYTNGVRTILVKSTGNDNEPVYMRLDIAMNLTDEQKEAAVQSLGLDERYSPKIKKVFHQFSVPVQQQILIMIRKFLIARQELIQIRYYFVKYVGVIARTMFLFIVQNISEQIIMCYT